MVKPHTSDIRMAHEHIQVAYGWHMSTYEWQTDEWHTITYQYIRAYSYVIRMSLVLLRERCPNTDFFLVRIQSEHRKIQTRKNSVFGLFSRSVFTRMSSACYSYVVLPCTVNFCFKRNTKLKKVPLQKLVSLAPTLTSFQYIMKPGIHIW